MDKTKNHLYKKSHFFRNFVIIMALSLIVYLAFVLQNKRHLFERTSKDYEIDFISDRAIEELPKNTEYAPATAFVKHENSIEEDKASWGNTNVVKSNEEVAIPATSRNHDIRNTFNSYRLYLANANKLVSKFRSDTNYSAELYLLKKQTFPSHIEEIILMLEQYNSVLVDSLTYQKTDVELFNSKIFAKFVKITKIPNHIYRERRLKNNIMNSLALFTDYLFSSDLQENFINQ